MESVGPVLSAQRTNDRRFNKDDTVTISPHTGGGIGRFVQYTQDGAMIDVKGDLRELAIDQFSAPSRDLSNGNEWFHVTVEPTTTGTMNDKPEFRSGDMVQVADVYGSAMGSGFGVFVAYSTDGKQCIISFDGEEILVPTANVASVLEQDAKDNFGEMDNDGNLSPMSLGSENVKIEGPEMDHRDEFSKWMASVEEALSMETTCTEDGLGNQSTCECGNWECEVCFPPETGSQVPGTVVVGADDGLIEPEMGQPGIGMAGAKPVHCPTCGHEHDNGFSHDDDEQGLEVEIPLMGDEFSFDEEDNQMELEPQAEERPRSGKGKLLGKVIQKFVRTGDEGEDSPLTYGEDNLDEDFGDEDQSEMIGKISYMQDMGLSKANQHYTEEQLAGLPPEQLKSIHNQVMGGMAEATKPTKPKTQTFNPDEVDDILNPRPSHPIAKSGDGEFNDTLPEPDAIPTMPTSSAADTRRKTQNINPSELMRDYMSRINPEAGADEPELEPQDPENELVIRSADDVPSVISSAMQATGVQTPEWHTVDNLPGYQQRNVRGMGRQVFGMFTSTPLEQIRTIANVEGQGPNTDAEMRAVASWLQNNAEDLGEVELSHGRAIPGYRPDVKEYRANGIRFHVVRDPMGQYIYAYPDADARTPGGQGMIGQERPQLSEAGEMKYRPSLLEQLKFDEIIRDFIKESEDVSLDEEELDESSLSKLIGKQKGGQKLVKWLHSRHKLANLADLQPQPFNERMLWKEFKRNPDNFVVVSAENGVAGIKPYEKQIRDRMEAARKRGREYDPGGDSTLQYQIIAFTDDGEQIDPALLQPKPEEGEERDIDPTVMKARMGKISGRDIQNPDNVFNLLAEQIGALKTVYLATGAVEREKMAKRAELKKPEGKMAENEALTAVFKRVRPVLKKLANTALSQISNRAKRYLEGGNFEAGQKVMATGAKLRQLLATIDTIRDLDIGAAQFGTAENTLATQIKRAITGASGSNPGTPGYQEYLNNAARGKAAELKPILDALRDTLVGL